MKDDSLGNVFDLNLDSLLVYGPADSSSLLPLDSSPPVAADTIPPPFINQFGSGPEWYSHTEIIGNSTGQLGWIFWVIMAGLTLIAITRFTFPRRFSQVVQSFFSERSLVNMLREGDLFTERIMLGLIPVYAAGLALLILMFWQLTENTGALLSLKALGWIVLSVLVILWWILRSLMVWLLGFIYKTYDATALYLSRMLSTNLGLGILLMVFLPLAWYGQQEWMIHALVFAVLAINLYRILRSLGDGLSLTPYGLSYLLLFGLTVEILPLLMVAGFIKHNL